MNFCEHMLPASKESVFKERGYYVWCGTLAKEGDTYCLLYSRWPKKSGIGGWVVQSEICLAVSVSPFGPFRHEKVIFTKEDSDRWDRDCFHNPTLLVYNGKYYLYYMGNYGKGDFWSHRNNQRIGVAWTDSLINGEWTRSEKPVIDVSAEGFDSLMTSNPTVTLSPEGKIVMVYKGVDKEGKPPRGGAVVCGTALADRPEGPFVKSEEPIMVNPTNSWSVEDPFVWYNESDRKYYALVKDFQGYFTKTGTSSTALFVSENGLDGFNPDPAHPLAFSREIHWEDGTVQQVANLERPQIYFEDGKPKALLLACAADVEWNETFNLQIPLDF